MEELSPQEKDFLEMYIQYAKGYEAGVVDGRMPIYTEPDLGDYKKYYWEGYHDGRANKQKALDKFGKKMRK